MRRVIQILLGIFIFVLGYLIVESIMRPIRFQRLVENREIATINRLKDIREAEKAYKDVYKKFIGDFDTLKMFLENDSFTVIKAIGTIPEAYYDEYNFVDAKAKALKEGIISREETKINIMDSLFGHDFALDSLSYVPFTDGIEFELAASEILTSSNLMVQVVEAKAHYDDLLKGLNEQLIINYKDVRITMTGYAGILFGSLEEGTLTGNWE